ncbi:hypothetical protein BJY52DRAFT_1209500 [Lactarius psammicola]|nr:hypothetical protein BJY52DRAFT_1209500 [Lactarius psammicola]
MTLQACRVPLCQHLRRCQWARDTSICRSTWRRRCHSLSPLMRQLSPTQQLIASALNAVVVGRYSITCEYVPLLPSKLTNQDRFLAAYVVCFYDWIISLDQEVAFIYPAPWNAVKAAYLFCRYYPLVIAPFHFWGFIGDHEQSVCESYYHALYACTMPTMLSSQVILMLRTYAFTGRKRTVLAALLVSFFSLVGVVIWVMSSQLNLTALFIIEKRSGCFATSDQPISGVVRTVGAYHLGMISVRCHLSFVITLAKPSLYKLLSAIFDCLNMFLVIQVLIYPCIIDTVCHCLFGSGHAGILVYVIMTALNALTIGTYFSSNPLNQGVGAWFAYILPSALTCRLVLMLRRKASPTETKLLVQYSHMVDEALELVESHYETSEGFMPSSSTHAQP